MIERDDFAHDGEQQVHLLTENSARLVARKSGNAFFVSTSRTFSDGYYFNRDGIEEAISFFKRLGEIIDNPR